MGPHLPVEIRDLLARLGRCRVHVAAQLIVMPARPGASWQAATATAVPCMRGEGREVHLDAEAAVWVTSVSRGGH